MEWLLLGVLGAIVFVDAWPVGQTMLSRPIVVGPLAGTLLGAPAEGVFWGAVFEAVYLGILPVGAARYPDAGLAALVGTVIASRGDGSEAAAYLVAMAFAAGFLGDWTSGFLRRWNGHTAASVARRVAAGDLDAPGRGIAVGVARGAALGAAAAVGCSAIAVVGFELVEDTVWAGPASREALRLAALAAAVVSAGRFFLKHRSGRLAWLTGLVVAAGLASWAGGTGS
ncbi:MAG TPA: PTS sugar transporter subunit IIC [Gemmatimonadota bacterium]|nr:PTS sugar transporter subunit IIC [Gemmatimonadota bacterium]